MTSIVSLNVNLDNAENVRHAILTLEDTYAVIVRTKEKGIELTDEQKRTLINKHNNALQTLIPPVGDIDPNPVNEDWNEENY